MVRLASGVVPVGFALIHFNYNSNLHSGLITIKSWFYFVSLKIELYEVYVIIIIAFFRTKKIIIRRRQKEIYLVLWHPYWMIHLRSGKHHYNEIHTSGREVRNCLFELLAKDGILSVREGKEEGNSPYSFHHYYIFQCAFVRSD